MRFFLKLLAVISFFFVSLVNAQVTIPFNNTLGPNQFIDITPVGGFAAGTTLSSFSITMTNYVASGGSVLEDLAVAVAPATPTSANAVFVTDNAGGLTAPAMANWTPGLAVPGTGAVNLTTPIPLFGMKLWIGNAYPAATATWAGSFTYPSILATPAPTVTSITPVQGSTTGGTSVTLTGTNLTGATSITVGGAACTSVSASATSATCTTPAGTAGTASVLVTTPGGTNAANTLFTYETPVAAPIPTLSEWAMILLASLMGMFAFARIRRQS
ncbi:IPTL-CTERM sorting domain-containing protein [Limnohabitans sp. 2KL-51]|uniref:IPTL-CTERM sorting domain-containing protein n=1 Tax=Limnohabitans sp. 2KL-51 TaxID=1977911 RepID=UPI000D3A5C00|nr:IPTL-CTERM sorting domain-containing protein [Limnohabitans sp. 2KL-51]PUE49574.1 hypothetical protein B9Z49_06330 [Limnohabitans sp. 2KL-51]